MVVDSDGCTPGTFSLQRHKNLEHVVLVKENLRVYGFRKYLVLSWLNQFSLNMGGKQQTATTWHISPLVVLYKCLIVNGP